MNELTISLDAGSRMPLYEQLYNYIKTNIREGRIPYGEKLPSTRALSRHLEVSRSTVELAYEQLLSEGFIESRPCKGYFVLEIEELFQLKKIERMPSKKMPGRKYKYDFTPNGVDLKSFPYNAWRRLSKEILMDDRTELFRSGDSRGEYGFRTAICNYLYQARGVNCAPEQVVVGAGNDYIVMLLSMILGREHKFAFEDPAYMQAYRLIRGLSYETEPVAIDKCGMCVPMLESSGADIAYVTPSHQYPTGAVMPIKRRMELLRWADEQEGRYIIEDDYDSEFRYKGKTIPALQGYDIKEKVIYLGTFSKSIAPAIRLSYMVLPPSLLEAYEKKCGFVNSTVSKVDQLIVQKFIEEGYYERHLNKTRALYKSRHDTLMEELRPLQEVCQITGEYAGVHLLLLFKEGFDEKWLLNRAGENDVKVYGLSDYRISPVEQRQAGILLGYANMPEDKIREAVSILTKCWTGKEHI